MHKIGEYDMLFYFSTKRRIGPPASTSIDAHTICYLIFNYAKRSDAEREHVESVIE